MLGQKSWMKKLEAAGLSRREVEVANQVMGGHKNSKIAALMGIGEKTVKFHLTAVYKKLNIKSRAQLMAIRMGLK